MLLSLSLLSFDIDFEGVSCANNLEMSQLTPVLCQGDAFLLELEAVKAAESSKASRKKKKKKKGVPDLQAVRT